jgi:hypothetical protein
MPITLNDSTISGLAVGGLPSGIITADLLASSAVTQDKVNIPGFWVQVQQGTFTSVATYNAGGGSVDTGLSVSITPKYSSSRILLIAHVTYSCPGTTYGAYFKRNGTELTAGTGDARGSRQRVNGGLALERDGNQTNTYIFQYTDSPGTTSALSYVLAVRNDNGNEFRLNRAGNDQDNAVGSNLSSSLTAIEIKQ